MVGLEPVLEVPIQGFDLSGEGCPHLLDLLRRQLDRIGGQQELAPIQDAQARRMGIPAHAPTMTMDPVEHELPASGRTQASDAQVIALMKMIGPETSLGAVVPIHAGPEIDDAIDQFELSIRSPAHVAGSG